MGRHKKPDKLTQENAQALAAGMSYGKWKALHPVSVEEKLSKPYYNIKKCAFCGFEFRSDSGKKVYCSDSCREKAYLKRKRGE